MKKIFATAVMVSISAFMVLAQPPAGTFNKHDHNNTHPDSTDPTGPRGHRTSVNGRRVLKGDSAENSQKQTRKEAKQANSNANTKTSKRTNASNR